MSKKRKSTDATRARLPSALNTPLSAQDFESEAALQSALAKRWQMLLTHLNIATPTDRTLALVLVDLTTRLVPGLKVRLVRTRPKARSRGGRPKLKSQETNDFDLVLLVACVDRLKDGGASSVLNACQKLKAGHLRKLYGLQENSFKEFSAKQLANQFNKHSKSVRKDRLYFHYFPEKFCTNPEDRCFSFNQFSESDPFACVDLCKRDSRCGYRDLVSREVQKFASALNPKQPLPVEVSLGKRISSLRRRHQKLTLDALVSAARAKQVKHD